MADTAHFAFRATHDLGNAAYADWADAHLGTLVTGTAERKGDFLEAIMALPWLAEQPGVDFRSFGDVRSLHALMTTALAEATAVALAARVEGAETQPHLAGCGPEEVTPGPFGPPRRIPGLSDRPARAMASPGREPMTRGPELPAAHSAGTASGTAAARSRSASSN